MAEWYQTFLFLNGPNIINRIPTGEIPKISRKIYSVAMEVITISTGFGPRKRQRSPRSPRNRSRSRSRGLK